MELASHLSHLPGNKFLKYFPTCNICIIYLEKAVTELGRVHYLGVTGVRWIWVGRDNSRYRGKGINSSRFP